jgi:hypothetical protein
MSAGKVSQAQSPGKLKTIVCSGPGSPPAKDGPPPLTVVLDMQKEYGRHKKLLLGMKELKEGFFEADLAYQRLFSIDQ